MGDLHGRPGGLVLDRDAQCGCERYAWVRSGFAWIDVGEALTLRKEWICSRRARQRRLRFSSMKTRNTTLVPYSTPFWSSCFTRESPALRPRARSLVSARTG